MNEIKSPKSCAYARLGKTHKGKNGHQQKIARRSTGNLYEEIMQQIGNQQQSYIRGIVNRAESFSESQQEIEQNRQSSSEVQVSGEEGIRMAFMQHTRQQRGAHRVQQVFRPKIGKQCTQSCFVQSSFPPKMAQTQSFQLKQQYDILSKKQRKRERAFIDNINGYLQELNDIHQYQQIHWPRQRMAQTMKRGEQSNLVSKLARSQMKIKQLKLKNYYQQKQLHKYSRKQQKMKEILRQLLSQIKQLNSELTQQKKDRIRLEKIVKTFELDHPKQQRKTIGKFKSQKPTQNHHGHLMSFAKQDWKNVTAQQPRWARQKVFFGAGHLNDQRIDRMFRLHDSSSED